MNNYLKRNYVINQDSVLHIYLEKARGSLFNTGS